MAFTLKFVILLLIFLLLFLVEPSFAQENPITEFMIPANEGNRTFVNAFAITSDDTGIWFIQRVSPSIVHFDIESSTFTSYPLNMPIDHPIVQIWGMTIGPNGMIWFTDATYNKIRTFDPATGTLGEFLQLKNDSMPWDIKFDSNGKLWFTEFGTSYIASVKPDDPTSLIEYRIPSNISSPSYFEFDKNENIWIVESGPGKLTKFNTKTNQFTEFILPSEGVGGETVNPIGLAIDNDGNIWYSQFRTSLIGKLNPNTNEIKEYATGTLTAGTYQIISDKEGNIWTTQFRADRIIKISPSTNSISEFKIPTDDSFTQTLTVDSDGNIWFIERDQNILGFLNSQHPEPTKISFEPKILTIDRPASLISEFNIDSDVDVFFLARGNYRVTGLLDGLSVDFTPSNVDPNESTTVTYSIQADREFPEGVTQLTIGAATMDLSYYTGSFVEVKVQTGLSDPIFLFGLAISIVSAILILRKSNV